MQENFIEKSFRVIIATMCALSIGITMAIMVLQEEPWLKKMIQEHAIEIITEYTGPNITLEIQAINILGGEIVIKNFEASAEDRTWKVVNESFFIKISLFDLIFKKTLHAQFKLHGLHITTTVQNNNLAIAEPVLLFLKAPSLIPFKLKGLAIRSSSIEIIDNDKNARAALSFSSDSYMQRSILKNKFFIQNGSLCVSSKKRLEELQGTIGLTFQADTNECQVQAHTSLVISDARENSRRCNIHFTYDKAGELTVLSEDKSLTLYGTNIAFSQGISAVYHCHLEAGVFSDQAGSININGQIVSSSQGFKSHAKIACNDIGFISKIKNVEVHVSKTEKNYDAVIAINNIPKLSIHAKENEIHAGSQKSDRTFEIAYRSVSEIPISQDYSIKTVSGEIGVSSENGVRGTVVGACADAASKLQKIEGDFSYSNGSGALELSVAGSKTKIFINVPNQQIDAESVDETGQQMMALHYGAETEKIAGIITFAPIKKLVKHLFSMDLQGEGTLIIDGTVHDRILKINTYLQHGTIKIPHVYNTVKQVDATLLVDLNEKKIILSKFSVGLHTGQIDITEGVCYFNGGWIPRYISIPVNLQSCLGNWERVFFGLASGYLIFTHIDGNSSLSGTIIVDKSHIKLNGLSAENKDKSVLEAMHSMIHEKHPIAFDIKVLTKSLIKIKTSFIETEARAKIRLRGTVADPIVTGKISMHEGFLAFPYKPLYIQEAKIYLNPEQLADSSIELVAKNTIKKFVIQMDVTGSLQAPHIVLSSSPTLHEEQILTMLLAGSQEGSLFGVMPQMVMQGVEKILFTTESSSDWLQTLKNVLKPLGNIRIKPAIFDKQNKPVKGGFEIDINDSLTASIANNLDLTDEPSVEVEYALSDATTLRGTRDDKGNISGEIEVRWKF